MHCWRAAALVLATVGSGLVACAPATSSDATRTVVLDVQFSRFSTSALTVRSGEAVTFVVRNRDPIPHELIVGDETVQDQHEKGTEAHHRERLGEVSVAAGATAATTYVFREKGRVLFGCHLPGHWAYGMRGTIDVR